MTRTRKTRLTLCRETRRTYQDTGLSPSDYHHSRLTCRDAYIDECTIKDSEEYAKMVRRSDLGRVHVEHFEKILQRTRIKTETDPRLADSHAHLLLCVMKRKAEGKCAALDQWLSNGVWGLYYASLGPRRAE